MSADPTSAPMGHPCEDPDGADPGPGGRAAQAPAADARALDGLTGRAQVSAGQGTAAGLLEFLRARSGGDHGLSQKSWADITSVWRSVIRTLDLPGDHEVAGMDLDDTMHAFVARRGGVLRSQATYRHRLGQGLRHYQAHLGHQPLAWYDRPRPDRTGGPAHVGPGVRRVSYSLRPEVTIRIELPDDLTSAEITAITAWLHAYRRNPPE